jgi:bla regulator protein blaR1
MSSHAIFLLVAPTIASSAAIVLIGLLRMPLRNLFGAQAAYWVWLVVPAGVLAVLLPAPSHPLEFGTLTRATVAAVPESGVAIAVLIWAIGTLAMVVLAMHRQRAFVRSLGLASLPNGTYQSAAIVEPMLIGAWRPRVVVPVDFESRYTREERVLVLAHERAHVERGDALANAVAVAWLCLSWFNPLAHWAIGWFRFDQELACDARVLAATGIARRRYAVALLKTQLSADAFGAVPAACHWRSGHPLTARIALLKRPSPSHVRRMVGVALTFALVVSTGYVAWASQPGSPAPTRPAKELPDANHGNFGVDLVSPAETSSGGDGAVKICPVTHKPMTAARRWEVI